MGSNRKMEIKNMHLNGLNLRCMVGPFYHDFTRGSRQLSLGGLVTMSASIHYVKSAKGRNTYWNIIRFLRVELSQHTIR